MVREVRTTVAIIGAGPAGLTLANLLQQRGTDCVVLDKFSRKQILERARAGLLENRTVELLDRLGLSARLHAEAAVHHGCEFGVDGESFFADYSKMYDGKPHFVYPQQEVVADLLDGFESSGGTVHYETQAAKVLQVADQPRVECTDGTVVHAESSRARTGSTARPGRACGGMTSTST